MKVSGTGKDSSAFKSGSISNVRTFINDDHNLQKKIRESSLSLDFFLYNKFTLQVSWMNEDAKLSSTTFCRSFVEKDQFELKQMFQIALGELWLTNFYFPIFVLNIFHIA